MRTLVLALLLITSACGAESEPKPTESDAGVGVADAGTSDVGEPDSGSVESDAGPAAVDAGPAEVDENVWRIAPEPGPEDLQAFGQFALSAEVLGLGETVHLTHDFEMLKAAIVRYLVAEQDFRTVAFETPWGVGRNVAEYVDTCVGTPEEAAQNLAGYWRDEAIVGLLEWLCEWNAANPEDPVVFIGFDTQQPWTDIAYMRAVYNQVAPQAVLFAEALEVCPGAGSGTAAEFYRGTEWTAWNNGDTSSLEASYQPCLDAIAAARGDLAVNEEAYRTAISDTGWAYVEVALTGMEAFARGNYADFVSGDRFEFSRTRSESMAIAFQAGRATLGGGQRAIVWAHDMHVMKRRNSSAVYGGVKGFGEFLREDRETSYRAVGLAALDTEYLDPATGMPAKWPAPEAGSLEQAAGGLGADALFMEFRPRFSLVDAFSPVPYSIDQIALTEQFDGVLWLRITAAKAF